MRRGGLSKGKTFLVLTNNKDNEWTLVNAATRSGYSTTPVSPSRRLRFSWGGSPAEPSVSEKSGMLGLLVYIRRWRGVSSPLPFWNGWLEVSKAGLGEERITEFENDRFDTDGFYEWDMKHELFFLVRLVLCLKKGRGSSHLIIDIRLQIPHRIISLIPRFDHFLGIFWDS